MKNWKSSGLMLTPLAIIIVVAAAVLGTELLFMLLLHKFLMPMLELPDVIWDVIDAVTLAAVIAPLLYFLVFRKMQESEERFRQINVIAPNAIVIVNEQGRITNWNLAAQRVFQYSQEEVVGQQMHQLIAPPRYRDDAEHGFARFEESGAGPLVGKTTEVSALRKDGSEFPVELSISAVKLKGRWHAIGIIHDITERKLAEEELRLRAQLLDSVSDTIFVLDLNGNFVYLNEAAWKTRGYTRDEMMGIDLHVLDTPKYEKLIESRMRDLMEKGRDIFESEHRRKDGSVMPVEINAHIIELGGRKLALSVIRDISERKRAEDTLRESEERYRFLFENMLEGYAYCKMLFEHGTPLDFIYLNVNDAFEKITGLKDVIGKKVSEAIPGIRASNPELFEIYGRVALTGQPEAFETYVDVLGIWFSITVYSPHKEYFVAVFNNITERKRMEKESLEAGARIRDALENAIGAIAATLEQRDPYTAGHQRRVAQLAAAIGAEMGLAREVIEGIHFGGLIHDIGKISVPAEILGKPGRLTDIEFGLIKTHAEAGYQIVKEIAFPWPVADMVRQHHERLDGSGYPQGLKGEQIVLEARILAVADVVEAMSANRPYRPGLGVDAALDEITRARGTQLDPVAVDTCLRIIREKGFVFTK